jgi:hypothetical protein
VLAFIGVTIIGKAWKKKQNNVIDGQIMQLWPVMLNYLNVVFWFNHLCIGVVNYFLNVSLVG